MLVVDSFVWVIWCDIFSMLNFTVAPSTGKDGTVNVLIRGEGEGNVTIVVPIDKMFSLVTRVLWKPMGVAVLFSRLVSFGAGSLGNVGIVVCCVYVTLVLSGVVWDAFPLGVSVYGVVEALPVTVSVEVVLTPGVVSIGVVVYTVEVVVSVEKVPDGVIVDVVVQVIVGRVDVVAAVE